jgi:hypothetical protein
MVVGARNDNQSQGKGIILKMMLRSTGLVKILLIEDTKGVQRVGVYLIMHVQTVCH